MAQKRQGVRHRAGKGAELPSRNAGRTPQQGHSGEIPVPPHRVWPFPFSLPKACSSTLSQADLGILGPCFALAGGQRGGDSRHCGRDSEGPPSSGGDLGGAEPESPFLWTPGREASRHLQMWPWCQKSCYEQRTSRKVLSTWSLCHFRLMIDHLGTLPKVQGFYGTAHPKPTTRGLTMWVGFF